MKHEAIIYNSYDRILATNHKTGQHNKTVGWNTRCTCGTVIVTKQNSLKLHKSKVQKHVELAQS